jgi:hypothetical protein
LYVGLAVHLLGHMAFRRRNVGTWNPYRSLAAVVMVVLVVLPPLPWQLPAPAALALVASVLAGPGRLRGREVQGRP